MEEKETIENVEVNICYMMSRAMDRLMLDAERRLVKRNIVFRQDKKVLFRRLMESIAAVYRYSAKLNEDIELSAKPSGYKDLDVWSEETNEMCRLILLYSDKCGKYPDAANQVFKLLRSFEGEGIITEEALQRFYLKKG